MSFEDSFENIKKINPSYLIFKPNTSNSTVDEIREFIFFLQNNDIDIPIILNLQYTGSFEDIKILASSELGLILYEKFVDSILLETNSSKIDNLDLSLNILQACNLKKHKTEFIACPGCGRTLFDIQKVLKKIKEKTPNMPDLKIAVMGCIVNGPGEMQDADFGYVGSGEGKIDLYMHKKCIEKNIDEKDAVDKLISLIEKHTNKEKVTL